MTFDQLAGQTSIKTILRQQLKEDKVSHNYLFTGGRGTGKTSTARLLAKSVNATVIGSDGLPDLLHDPVSLQIDKNQSLDIIEIDAASHTGVDNVREEIIQKSSYPPSQLKKKVYIIDEVHMLSKSAFNALLKIMEEPPAWIMFILATTEYHKVPDTIISRCQVFHFQQLSHDEMVKHLSYIADTEKLVYDQEWLSMIARYTGGAMRDAIKYLEQLAMFHDATAEQVRNFLGIASSETIHDLVTMLRRGGRNCKHWFRYAVVCRFFTNISTDQGIVCVMRVIILWMIRYGIASLQKSYSNSLKIWDGIQISSLLGKSQLVSFLVLSRIFSL
jgi:DNA polymerase-3 subunit gamma/tau